jgi:hypothetical protein
LKNGTLELPAGRGRSGLTGLQRAMEQGVDSDVLFAFTLDKLLDGLLSH